MSTKCKRKLVSLTSATTNTMMFSIYKNNHNKVCGGPCGRRISLRVHANPAGQHQLSPWFQHHQLHSVTTAGDFFFSCDSTHWIHWLLGDYFLNSLICKSTMTTILSTWLVSTHFSDNSSNTFSKEPPLAIAHMAPNWLGAIKHMEFICIL